MSAKKKPDPPKEGAPSELAARNTGAPANLRRMEIHEEDAEREVNALKERLRAVQELIEPNGDDEKQKPLREQCASIRMQLDAAYDLWFKLSKQVRDFDKSVKEERRDGEKALVSEVKEWFIQFRLSLGIARENYIIGMAQQSGDPMKFVKAHAELIRSTEDAAILSAISEGVIPRWVIE